jgi:hypothetical protein
MTELNRPRKIDTKPTEHKTTGTETKNTDPELLDKLRANKQAKKHAAKDNRSLLKHLRQ